jgi:hypothetical protein
MIMVNMRQEKLLEIAIKRRVKEWNGNMNDAQNMGDSHFMMRCDVILTILKNVLKEGGL